MTAWRSTDLTRTTSWSTAVRRCGCRDGPGVPGGFRALGRRPSRGAAILGIAGLIVGLAAGYALGYRHLGQAVRPCSRATAAAAVPRPWQVSPRRCTRPRLPGAGAYSSSLGVAGLSGLAQTGGACSVQRGRELQVGVEVINLSETAVTLGQVKPILPLGGLRLVSQQWAPCGALSPSWQAADGGMIVFVKSSAGVGRGGKRDRGGRGGPAAERHRLAQRHLPGASGVPEPAAGAVQRQLPGERPDGHRAAAGIPGSGAGHVHRVQGQLLDRPRRRTYPARRARLVILTGWLVHGRDGPGPLISRVMRSRVMRTSLTQPNAAH